MREFDSQLLESVAVRRRRMRDALVFGAARSRRSVDENLGRVFGGVALTTVEQLNPNISPNALQTGERLRLRR